MRWRHLLIIGLLCGAAGCGQSQRAAIEVAAAQQQAAAAAAEARKNAEVPGKAVFVVVKPDGVSQPFGMDDLKKLPLTTIFADGSPQEGPTLLAVLKAAGVAHFQEVAVTGREGTKKLARAGVTSDLVLDFNNRGSVKLASPTMPRDERIRDITRIEIK
jgi:predicted flap endonuclease-1-like 5' DNA nuclease